VIWRLLAAFAATYMVLCGFMFFYQRHLLYFPASGRQPPDPVRAGVPEIGLVRVETADGLSLLAWFAPPRAAGAPVVLYFHGNGGTIGDRGHKAALLMKAGYGIFLAEYRGYGGNPGSPTEDGLYADAEAALAWLAGQGYGPERIVLYGESLGTGVAVEMAVRHTVRGLILEAPFSSMADAAKTAYGWLPVDLLLKDRYDNAAKIASVKVPLLILHGDADHVVPSALGQKLFAAAGGDKEFVLIPGGGHSDLYDHGAWDAMERWLGAIRP
jgi:uncharacterized protein